MGFLFLLGVVIFFVILISTSKSAENDKLKSESVQEGIIYYPKEGEFDEVLPVIKKRSEKLAISFSETQIEGFVYVKDTPHLRTIAMSNVATTEYVDNSGFKSIGPIDSGRGCLQIFNEVCPRIYISKELYNKYKQSRAYRRKLFSSSKCEKNPEYVELNFYNNDIFDHPSFDQTKYLALSKRKTFHQIKKSYDKKNNGYYYIDMFDGEESGFSGYYARGLILVGCMKRSKKSDLQDLIDWLTLKQ